MQKLPPPAEAEIIDIQNIDNAEKDKLEHSIRHYWPIRSELAMIDGIAMKGSESMYWISIDTGFETL